MAELICIVLDLELPEGMCAERVRAFMQHVGDQVECVRPNQQVVSHLQDPDGELIDAAKLSWSEN